MKQKLIPQREMAFANEPFVLIQEIAPDGDRIQQAKQQQAEDRAAAETLQTVIGETISSYSRAQAVEDGVLVDLMQPETVGAVREAGFKYPVAMTAAAFRKCIAVPDQPLPPCQDLQGRLWDVLWMLKCAISRMPGGDTIAFELSVRNWTNFPASRRHRLERVRLFSKIGPGDTPEPVITIMLPGED